MTKRQVIMLLGVWVMTFLFLGFPPVWDKIFALVTGFVLISLAYKMSSPIKPEEITENRSVPYVEHKSEIEAPINNKTL